MAAPAVVVVWNSRLSGTDAKPLKNVTFSEDLSDPGVHHRARPMTENFCGAVRIRDVQYTALRHTNTTEQYFVSRTQGCVPGPVRIATGLAIADLTYGMRWAMCYCSLVVHRP